MRGFRIRRVDPKVEAMREVELFRYCSDEVLADIAGFVTESHFAVGEVLCREGQIGRQAFVILAGQAAVDIGGARVGTLAPGEVVGDMALIDRGRRSATVTALTPMSVLTLSVLDFGRLLDGGGAPVREILVQLTRRLRELERDSFGSGQLPVDPCTVSSG